MRKIGRALVILALFNSLGLHWCALQSIAWTGMVIEFSKEAPLAEALAKALDGQHPCSLCHAVQKGQKSDRTKDLSVGKKFDFFCPFAPALRIEESVEVTHPVFAVSVLRRFFSPPTPPPRQIS